MSKKRSSSAGPLRAILLLLLVIVLILLGLYGYLRWRMNQLAQGSAFQLSYTIHPTTEDPSAPYDLFSTMGAVEGSVQGQNQGDRLSILFYGPAQSDAFLDVYYGEGETLINFGRFYRYYVSALTQEYPLLSALIPDWGLGDYVSQNQLALFFDQQPAGQSSMISGDLQLTSYPEGLSGYLYFAPETPEGEEPALLLGLSAKSLFSDAIQLHVRYRDEADGLLFELTGTVQPQQTSLQPPASRLSDQDAEAIRTIWQALRDLLALFNIPETPVEPSAA